MTSHVRAERTASCPFSIAANYAATHLSDYKAPRREPIRVPLARLGLPLRGALARRVAFSFGIHTHTIAASRRDDEEIYFTWQAGSRWLPDFRGTLRFRIASYRETPLKLEGTYDPPFGAFGALFDAVIGHHIAMATAEDLLSRVTEALETSERSFRAAHPPVP
jgi:hypothetical protein